MCECGVWAARRGDVGVWVCARGVEYVCVDVCAGVSLVQGIENSGNNRTSEPTPNTQGVCGAWGVGGCGVGA